MQAVTQLSEAKRRLLEGYLRGSFPQTLAAKRPITRRPSSEPALVSLSQEQLLLHENSMRGMPPLYNECFTLQMTGLLNVTAFEQGLAEIIRRHEIWRTSYDIKNGLLVHIVHPPQRIRLPLVDLRGFQKERLEEEVLQLVTEETQRPFDLNRGPLVRPVLVRTGDADYRLCIIAHLSIVDGISVYQLFPSELAALYAAFCTGRASPLAELSIQYSDYAYWQRHCLTDEELATQLAYWRNQLAGDVPVLQWPIDHPRPAVQTHRGRIHPFTLNRPLTDLLKHLMRREGVTLFTVLLASLAALFHVYTSQLDLIIGTPSPAGRKRSEVQKLLGYFLNPVALRINLQNNPSFRELLLQVQRVTAEAISYDDLPIETLAKKLQLKPNLSRNPFFTVAISLQPEAAARAIGWRVTSMDASSGGAVWDLYVAFINGIDEMMGKAQYNPDLFETATIDHLIQDLQKVLRAMAFDPGEHLSSLRLQ